MFSILDREKHWSEITDERLDLIIIGGGITGAGILLDAVSRGLKAVVFEKNDFAQGTSSRSTKLVHGGLRYLKNLEFGLVAEVGRERRVVHENAMHIVLPEKLLLPIIKGGTLGKITTPLALWMYDFLAGVKHEERYKSLSREKVLEIEPLLESDILRGGVLYYEYKTIDSRLTVEVMKKAVELGGLALNYAGVQDLVYEGGKLTGVKVFDKILNKTFLIKAKYIVNATGIWVDELRRKDNSLKGKHLHITKGIHIVIPREKIPLNHSIYFDVPSDGRMVFAIPKWDKIYIGTTDTDYNKDLDNPDIEYQDVKYLIDAANFIMPSANLSVDDVVSAWSGLRPLIHEEGKSPSELSRKDEIFVSQSGLISIAGGKLTGYRLMAKKVVDLLRKEILKTEKRDIGKCKTENIKLSGGDFPFVYEAHKLIDYADSKYDEARETGISVKEFKKLFYRYGTNIDKITDKAYEIYNKTKDTALAWLEAELWYLANYESIWKLTDYFVRRTGILHFFIEEIPQKKQKAAEILAKYLNLSQDIVNQQLEELEKEIYLATKSYKTGQKT